MELTNQILYLTVALITLGMLFPAYVSLNKSHQINSTNYFWFLAVTAQLLSSSCFALFPIIGKIGLIAGSTFQFSVDILLGLLFRSMHKKPSKLVFLILSIAAIVYFSIYYGEEYAHEIMLASLSMIVLSVWQLYELVRLLKRRSSIYIWFLISAISTQIIFGFVRIDEAIELINTGHLTSFPFNRYEESAHALLARLPILLLYVLIFMGIGNHYFESLWELAQQQKNELEEQMTNVLVKLASARDNSTGKHLLRTQQMIKVLAESLKNCDFYTPFFTKKNIERLSKAAPLHDIGKVGIPDSILLKPGKLTPEEFTIMKTHALLGEQILSAALTEENNPIIATAVKLAGSHHEHWDGTGYPRGLKGEEIPIEGRVMAIVDVYDALTTKRIYKTEWSHQDVVAEISKLKNTHFDPKVVEAFILVEDEFRKISQHMKDPDLGLET